jgi:NSS family neurotransmitter:Na+ symporter
MARINSTGRDSFTSNIGVIAAAAGSAIGLGNIWRFPYVAGENGGGAFLFIYLGFVLLIGLPVMLSEFTIGRNTQRNAVGSFLGLAPGKPWFLIGAMGVICAFMILAFYAAVAGWTLEYLYQAVTNSFSGKSPEQLSQEFSDFRDSSFWPILWFLIFMVLTAGIVMAGVKNGIEKYTKILMPVLLLIIIILIIRSVTLPGAGEGLSFLFRPDFSKIKPTTILEALGQAFFSLSIGMGTLITYGSYIQKKDHLGSTALNVSMADTLIAVLAGMAIFPAVFAFGIDPAAEEGLVFITLPNIFQQMAGGYIFALLFFILLSVAALTSTISVLEVVVAFMAEELRMKRRLATLLSAGAISILGILAAGSWGWFSGITIAGKNIFGVLNWTTANLLLPVGGFFIVIFVGWFMGKNRVKEEISNRGSIKARFLGIFIFIVRYIAPVAIALVFLNGVGALNFLSS